MDTELPIPSTAKEKYVLLKVLGEGKDGAVILAVPRTGPQNLSTCVALKILAHHATGAPTTELLEDLKGMAGL
jgi:hypothetical protein